MNFSTATKVFDTIDASREVEQTRSENRQKINDLFNCVPPLNEGEAEDMNLKINTNWGEAAVLAQQARRQYYNAFLRRGNFFKIRIPLCKDPKCNDWENWITQRINRPLKQSLAYYELHRNRWSSVVLHGAAPMIWYDKECWCPELIPLEDFRVPTDTEISLRNCQWFAQRKWYREAELSNKAFGKYSDGWNKEMVQKILNAYHDKNWEEVDYDWTQMPEKMAELVKQNGGFYSSDAVPVIPLWHFYFLDNEGKRNEGWKMRVVPDENIQGGIDRTDFIYNSGSEISAAKLAHILHIQFGDLNNKPPFLYHSVRSLGFALMEPCFWLNITRCRALQHLHESFNVWMRATDPAGKARAQKVEFFDRCFIPEGVSIVPQNERHQIDPNLLQATMEELRQLNQESSSSYTQNLDSEADRETATKTMALVSQTNAMMSSLLNTAFYYESFAYREICRRFTLRQSEDKDVRQFQKECRDFGIPAVWMDSKHWDVEPVVPIGGGNPTMEMAQVQQLLQMRPMYGPAAQQEILHEATTVVSDDPLKADRWAPLEDARDVTDGQDAAQKLFGTLMRGVPVKLRSGLNPIDQIETFLSLMAGEIQNIQKTGNMGTPRDIAGLQNVAMTVGQLIQQLAQNPQEKPRVKQYSDILGKLMNEVKGFAQRQQQMRQKMQQAGGDGGNGAETAAKIQGKIIESQATAAIKTRAAQQKEQQKSQAFVREQRRRDAETFAEIGRQQIKARSAAAKPE